MRDSVVRTCLDCKHTLCASHEHPCKWCKQHNKWEPRQDNQNPYWERISRIADKQRAKGMSKYGVGLENNTADATERARHIQEELIDALMYLTWLEEALKAGEADDQ